MKKLFILFILITLTGCSLKVKDPRGLHGRVLKDIPMQSSYMATKAGNGTYYLSKQLPDGSYAMPE